MMSRLHSDEVAIDETMVRRLLRDHLPELSGMPMKAVTHQGTDGSAPISRYGYRESWLRSGVC